jgi:hypothetical protein
MLYTKTSPVGIDIPIQKLQVYLHDQLNEIWGLSGGQYQAYGRCYRNQKEDGYVAEGYIGKNEYKELYLDDRYIVLSFFGLSEDIKFKIANTANVHLIFFVNLPKLKNVSHRADEEVRVDVQKLVEVSFQGFSFEGVRLDINNVLDEYPGSLRDTSLKFRDMHPFHCFRFDFSLLYDVSRC